MKTTFDLPPPLLDQARQLAAHRNTTVRELVISGLRKVLEDSARADKPFKLVKASVKGRGLQQAVRNSSPSQLIELSYESDKA